LKNYFLGKWNLTRQVTGSHQGSFTGTAEFVSYHNQDLLYRESGYLILPMNKPFWCERSYWYEFVEDGNIRVLFSDRREFLMMRFDSQLSAQATHKCECDTYDATYQFVSSNHLRITFKISGPSKQYSIDTHLIRVRPLERF
jgi:hypothetical protein